MNARKLVLLVSIHPAPRAALRRRLEAAGFAVGEAADGKEGMRAILRVKPDAVIADIEPATMFLAGELRAAAHMTHLYVESDALDLLARELDFQALGISGVFLRPADPEVVIPTLHMALAES